MRIRQVAWPAGKRLNKKERKTNKARKTKAKKARGGKLLRTGAERKEHNAYNRKYYAENKEEINKRRAKDRKRAGIRVGKPGRPKGSKNKKKRKNSKKKASKKKASKKKASKKKASKKKASKKKAGRKASKPKNSVDGY